MYGHQPSNTPITVKYEVSRKVYGWVIALLIVLVVLSLVGDWMIAALLSFLVSKG